MVADLWAHGTRGSSIRTSAERFRLPPLSLGRGLVLAACIGACAALATPASSQKPAPKKGPSEEKRLQAADAARKGVAAFDRGGFKEAIAQLSKCVQLDPTNPVYYYELALAQWKGKKLDAAVATIQRGRKVDPDFPDFYLLLGTVYDEKKKPDDAIAEFEAGLERYPDFARLYLELGVTYARKREYGKAIRTWNRGLRADPELPSLHYRLANAWSRTEERMGALLHAEQFLNLEPEGDRAQEMSAILWNALRDAVSKDEEGKWRITFTREVTLTETGEVVRETPSGVQPVEGRPPLGFAFELAYGMERAKRQVDEGRAFSIPLEIETRAAFLETWFEEEKLDEVYRVPLFERMRSIRKAGHLEAYTYRVLRAGSPEEVDEWSKENKEKYLAYLAWSRENPFRMPRPASRPADGPR